MLVYLYCTAYTRMTMNESSPLCEKMRIIFNDDAQKVQFARPELAAPHLHVQAVTNYTPITVHALLLPTHCRYQFTDSERMNSLVS